MGLRKFSLKKTDNLIPAFQNNWFNHTLYKKVKFYSGEKSKLSKGNFTFSKWKYAEPRECSGLVKTTYITL